MMTSGKNVFCQKGNGILLPKLFWPTVRKNCSTDREKLLKFKAEGRDDKSILKVMGPERIIIYY